MRTRGLGSQLVERVVEFARDEKVARLNASVLYENRPMLRILEKAGFRLIPSNDGGSGDGAGVG